MQWFYVYMAIVMLLIPIVMIVFGRRWKYNPPKQINSVYGYRTKRSMSSRHAWEYAHKICARIWFAVGCILLVAALLLIALMFILCHSVNTAGIWGGVVVFCQLICMIVSITVTERDLKTIFGI